MSTSPDVLNGEFAILPTFTCAELPPPDSTPFAASVIPLFLIDFEASSGSTPSFTLLNLVLESEDNTSYVWFPPPVPIL